MGSETSYEYRSESGSALLSHVQLPTGLCLHRTTFHMHPSVLLHTTCRALLCPGAEPKDRYADRAARRAKEKEDKERERTSQ